MLTSKLVNQKDFETDTYKFWCKMIHEEPRYHRKQWEFVQIAQALNERDCLMLGKRGLGFGVGQEPLVSLFASNYCTITATDLSVEDPNAKQWDNGQLAKDISRLYNPEVFGQDEVTFHQYVRYKDVDMNDIPDDFREYDFTWSSCAFEHLGSIQKGLDFIVNQMDCLKKGGWAVHTTEFNVSSNEDTLETNSCVIFREKDIRELIQRLEAKGYYVEPLDLDKGNLPHDTHIDLPPYCLDPHLKLKLAGFTTTSIILIIRK